MVILAILGGILGFFQSLLVFIALGVYFRASNAWSDVRCYRPVGYNVNIAAAILSLVALIYIVISAFFVRLQHFGVHMGVYMFLTLFWVIATFVNDPTAKEWDTQYCQIPFFGNYEGRPRSCGDSLFGPPDNEDAALGKRWDGLDNLRFDYHDARSRNPWHAGLDATLAILFFISFMLSLVRFIRDRQRLGGKQHFHRGNRFSRRRRMWPGNKSESIGLGPVRA